MQENHKQFQVNSELNENSPKKQIEHEQNINLNLTPSLSTTTTTNLPSMTSPFSSTTSMPSSSSSSSYTTPNKPSMTLSSPPSSSFSSNATSNFDQKTYNSSSFAQQYDGEINNDLKEEKRDWIFNAKIFDTEYRVLASTYSQYNLGAVSACTNMSFQALSQCLQVIGGHDVPFHCSTNLLNDILIQGSQYKGVGHQDIDDVVRNRPELMRNLHRVSL